MKKKVLVMMSGGVDSSVAALLLKEAGYEICGVTMRLFDGESVDNEIKDAQNVADFLGIKHMVLDLSVKFKQKVIDYFVSEYINGRTPNPCVMCNKYIKFGEMLKFAQKNGFDFLATGHYAKICYDSCAKKFLIRRSNQKKDQSYVLFNLTQKDLPKILFPIADLEKTEIRQIAQKVNLPVANKSESQEICFVKNNDYVHYIQKHSQKIFETGLFKDKNGNILGKHAGVINYTVGQRKGLGQAFGRPMYVNFIDAKMNEIILGQEGSQYADELVADKVNFVFFDKLHKAIDVLAKVRYKSLLAMARIAPISKDMIKVKFYEKQRAIAPGQAVVFYDDDVLLGGGIIQSVGNFAK